MNVLQFYKEGNNIFSSVLPPFTKTLDISLLNNLFLQKYKYFKMDLVDDNPLYVDMLVQTFMTAREKEYKAMYDVMMMELNPNDIFKETSTTDNTGTKTYNVTDEQSGRTSGSVDYDSLATESKNTYDDGTLNDTGEVSTIDRTEDTRNSFNTVLKTGTEGDLVNTTTVTTGYRGQNMDEVVRNYIKANGNNVYEKVCADVFDFICIPIFELAN